MTKGTATNARMAQMRAWTRSHGRLAVAGLTVAATVALPTAGSTQRLSLSPIVGVYVSGGTLFSQGSIDNPATYLEKRPEGAPILGFSAIYWLSDHFGVRGTVAFGPSETAVTDTSGTYDDPSGTWFANGELIGTLHPWRSINSVFVGLGGGMVSWKGSEWQYASGTTLAGFVGTIGATFPVRALWAMKPYKPAKSVWVFEVSDYLTHSQIDKGLPDQTPAAWRGDLTIDIGLSVSVGSW